MAPKAAFHIQPYVLSIIFFLFLAVSEASITFYVGGKIDGWKIQKKHTLRRRLDLNKWASSQRFQVGNFLEWNIDRSDSVLEVTQDDYDHCNSDTKSPVKRFFGQNIRAELDRPGAFYYISGTDHELCELGQRLHVVVMTPRTPPQTGHLPARPVLTGPPCTPSTDVHIISSGSSSLVPTSKSMQAGLVLFTLALLSVCL